MITHDPTPNATPHAVSVEQLIAKELDDLADLQAVRDTVAANYQDNAKELAHNCEAEIDGLVSLEIRDQIALLRSDLQEKLQSLQAEEAHQTRAVNANIADLTELIKRQIVAAQTSVKGAVLHAVYRKGAITWDSKKLDGFAAAHPEIEKFRKVGEPSVSIQPRKDREVPS